MKDIKNYICTLKQAKRLKELGVDQSCLLQWVSVGGLLEGEFYSLLLYDKSNELRVNYAAFTSQELMELILKYRDTDRPADHYDPDCKNEAEARAEFLIYLLESVKAS